MIRILILAFGFAFAGLALNAANIDWNPTDGYTSDEAELSGLLPEEIHRILDWMNSGRDFEENGQGNRACKRYKKVHKKFPKSQYAPEALARIAGIRQKQGKIDKAFDALQAQAYIYPNYGSYNDALAQMFQIATTRMTTHRDRILFVFPGFVNRDRAVKYFEKIVFIAPYSDYAPLALMNTARAWKRKNSDTMTIYSLNRLVTNYPNSMLTPDAYLMLAETYAEMVNGPYYDQRATEDAITFFQDFLIKYPGNERVGDAEIGLADSENLMALSKLKVADFYNFKRGNYKAAEVLYNEAISIAPLSKAADNAKIKLERIEPLLAQNAITDGSKEPTVAEMQKKAEKRAKRKVLGIF